jgi:hypothetical protein
VKPIMLSRITDLLRVPLGDRAAVVQELMNLLDLVEIQHPAPGCAVEVTVHVRDGSYRLECRHMPVHQQAETAVGLLTDAAAALRDLGACADADCAEPNCLRVLQRIETYLMSEPR